jgi:GGDEF domain-containing protein
VDSYARLASLWLSERSGSRVLGAGRDALTGCLTYAALLEQLDQEFNQCGRSDLDLACCFVSLESATGDRQQVLAQAGQALRGAIGDSGAVGRYGRAQFIVILPGADLKGAIRSGRAIRASLCAVAEIDARVGVAQWVPGTGVDRLLGDADRSLAAARCRARQKAPAAGV